MSERLVERINERPPGGRSAGAMLRAAREKQGLHIAALAAAIKVTQRKLEALEQDRYEELPDATFTRALAQTVCRTLKIDARPVLEQLPPVASVSLEPLGGRMNTPFRERPGREEPGLGLGAVRPLVWAASVLLVGALALYFWPAQLGLSLFKPFARPAATAAATAPAFGASSPEVVLPVDTAASAVAGVPGFQAAESAAVASAPVATAAPPAAETLAAAPAPVPGLVQLRPSAASWVQARDARGQLLLSRLVQPGEDVGLDGALPIRLTIGNASAMQLGFRGQRVDLAPSTRDNVARLELQ